MRGIQQWDSFFQTNGLIVKSTNSFHFHTDLKIQQRQSVMYLCSSGINESVDCHVASSGWHNVVFQILIRYLPNLYFYASEMSSLPGFSCLKMCQDVIIQHTPLEDTGSLFEILEERSSVIIFAKLIFKVSLLRGTVIEVNELAEA